MKQNTTLLALTLGLSAFTALAQSKGDQAKQLKDQPDRRPAKEERDAQRDDEARPDRSQRRDQAGPRQMGREGWDGPRQDFAPGRQGFGPQQPFAPGRPGFGPQQGFGPGRQAFGPQGRGQAWNRPGFAPRRGGLAADVCPHCGRPFGMNGARGWQQRGGQGFAPRQGFGPMQRGFGPQARGQAFGPPPWGGRGVPDGEMRPGPRGPQTDAPMPERGLGPMRRGPGAPGGDEGRVENRDQGSRREGQAPRDRRPAESEDR